jgi:phage/plasmid-like protein (TIGR03299 family)
MAHEFESGFFVKEAAWHKLGNVITDAPTTQEGIRLAGLDWSVALEPLQTLNGEVVDARALRRSSDGKILSVVGPQWTPVQNSSAFGFFDKFLESGEVSLETAGSLKGGKVVWILAKINTLQGEVVKGDPIQRYFMLSNGHYAGKSLSVGFTDIRVVCKNTMAMAEESQQSKLIRLAHGRNININLEEIQRSVNIASKGFQATLERLQALNRKGINRKDVQRFVDVIFFQMPTGEIKPEFQSSFEENLSTKSSNKRLAIIDKMEQLIEEGLGASANTRTAYGLYQAATEYFTHYDGKDYESRLDKLWLGSNKEKNQRAMEYLLAA